MKRVVKKRALPSRRQFLKGFLLAGAALAVERVTGALPIDALIAEPVSKPVLPRIHVIQRSAWSSLKPRLSLLDNALTFNRLTVHHAGMAVNTHMQWDAVISDLNILQEGHLNRNYGDIGYHFIIDYTGRIWEGRSLRFEGAHVYNANKQNLGVMLLGNFEKQYPAPAQITSLLLMVRALQRKYRIPASSLYGHCDLGPSACPGMRLYSPFVRQLRQPAHSL